MNQNEQIIKEHIEEIYIMNVEDDIGVRVIENKNDFYIRIRENLITNNTIDMFRDKGYEFVSVCSISNQVNALFEILK